MNALVKRTAIGHFLDVGSCGKYLLAAGDDHDANFLIAVKLLHRQAEIFDQAIGKRVQSLRPIQRHHRNRAVFFDDDILEIHSGWSF